MTLKNFPYLVRDVLVSKRATNILNNSQKFVKLLLEIQNKLKNMSGRSQKGGIGALGGMAFMSAIPIVQNLVKDLIGKI